MRNIQVLGIPFDFGQSHTGVRNAFQHLMGHGLSEMLSAIAPSKMTELKFWERTEGMVSGNIRFAEEAALASKMISRKIETLNMSDDFLLNVGGDHGMGLGSIHGVLAQNPDSVVIWADAHGDINTPETTPSGNFHGMPLAFLLNQAKHHDFEWVKRFINPKKLILLGPRDLDEGELDIIRRLEIQYFSSDEINRIGAKEILEMAINRADPYGTCPIHLSFDVDVFDGSDFHSTGTRVVQGPRMEEIFLMGGLIAETGRLRSMDLVEFNPQLGTPEAIKNSTELVLDFIQNTLKQVFEKNNETHFSTSWNGPSEIKNTFRAG